MRLRRGNRRRGMSLLEVLGATAIFLISIVAIGELMSVATDQAVEVQHRSQATRLCQSKLNEFASGVEQFSGATSGEFEEDPVWSWNADVQSETIALNLYRVTVTVTRDSNRGPVEVSMTQFIFDPLQRGHLTTTAPATETPEATTTTPATGSTTPAPTGGTGGTGSTGGGGTGGGGTGGGKK